MAFDAHGGRGRGIHHRRALGPGKFRAFCKVLPLAIGNPIHHWSHLELRRIFNIDLLINEANADAIWEQANAKLATMDTWSLLEQAGVEIACTTDDPADDLLQHAEIASSALKTRVLPAYRPDKAMRINQPRFIDYLKRLGEVSSISVTSFASLIAALAVRVEFFHSRGARISTTPSTSPCRWPAPVSRNSKRCSPSACKAPC